MGLFRKLFSKKEMAPTGESGFVSLAFVLLTEPTLPKSKDVTRFYSEFSPDGDALVESVDDGGEQTRKEILSLQFESGQAVFIALMPAAVPNGEADNGAQFSVSSLGTRWQLPDHSAHLIVTVPSSGSELSTIDRLSRFTSLLAAVAKASPSVGIYWGGASATHDSEFFISVAAEPGIATRMMLWTGISLAREPDGRLSMLSLGMGQLNLPDLLLVVAEPSEDTALETFFDLLAYVASRGEPLPEGDTVGRTADEKLPVHYVESPIGSGEQVWRVEVS